MRGKDHVMLSMATGVLLVSPLLNKDISSTGMYILFAFLPGVFIGSLLPDVDASDAKINYLEGIAWLFGWLMRPVILPLVRMIHAKAGFGFDPRHRRSVHTIFTLALSTIILLVFTFVILAAFGYWSNYILIFYLGIFIGGTLHLVEDCCTVSGLRPFEPFSPIHLRGGISTSNVYEKRPEAYAELQYGIAGVIIVAGFVFDVSVVFMSIVSIMAVCLSWLAIYRFSGTGKAIPTAAEMTENSNTKQYAKKSSGYHHNGYRKDSHQGEYHGKRRQFHRRK